MKKFLETSEKKFYTDLGTYKFSPIMKSSIGICMSYNTFTKKGKNEILSPLFFSFPEKKSSSLWLSISILTNYFLEDHIENYLEGIKLSRGDKIKIFGAIAQVERIIGDKITIKFKDQGGITINSKKLKPQISLSDSKRSLNKKQLFVKNMKNFRRERNPISKILEPRDTVIINAENLTSRVLLVAGKRKIKNFVEVLKELKIYDQQLGKTYVLGKNLLIKQDLEEYKNLFKKEKSNDLDQFLVWIKKLEENTKIDSLKIDLNQLLVLFDREGSISEKFEEFFYSMIDEFIDEEPKLKFIQDKYPGFSESLPDGLRVVIINDIFLVKEYPETIKEFISKNIPVIVTCDRTISNGKELNFLESYFDTFEHFYRFNWSRKKINELIKFEIENEKYLDSELWNYSKRFANQHVIIDESSGGELDRLIPVVQRVIRNLEGFDIIQRSFYQFFYPALYAIKNSKESSESLLNLVRKFKIDFDYGKDMGLEKEDIQLIDKTIELALNQYESRKEYTDCATDIYTNFLTSINKDKLLIPIENVRIVIPKYNTRNIVFTGYPYQEYSNKHLLDSVTKYFIPSVKIYCWKEEANLTYNYLKRRLKAGYFTDLLPENSSFPKELLMKSKQVCFNEIDEILSSSQKDDEISDQEIVLKELHYFRYKGYSVGSSKVSPHSVKCDIINFEDDSFIFIPKGSTVLSEAETSTGTLKIKMQKTKDLTSGLRIFKYKRDKTAYRNISKRNAVVNVSFLILEYWKEILESLYSACNDDIYCLKSMLKETKDLYDISEANPSYINLQHWLFDEETLCPRLPNLEMILRTAKVEKIDDRLRELDRAFWSVNNFTISLSSKIKKSISKILSGTDIPNSKFNLTIEGSKIEVESKVIRTIEESELEVEYHNTRKILC